MHQRQVNSNSNNSINNSNSGTASLQSAWNTHSGGNGKLPDTIECGQCEIVRPKTARHCHYCGVCTEKLDHHCPWCGKCIAKQNMPFFIGLIVCYSFHMSFLVGTLVYYGLFSSIVLRLPA